MVKTTFENLPDEKKKRIDHALLNEFSHYSLDEAQVARIVKDANIARGAFYKYFDDLTDAYTHIYGQAMKDIHMGFGKALRKFDPDLFYQMTVNFIEQAEKSPCCEMIKLHLSQNRMELHRDLQKESQQMLPLDAKTWSAMVLTHETIKLALFDPENRDKILKRYRESLELLKGE